VPVVGIAGSLTDDAGRLGKKGFTALFSIANRPFDLATAIRDAPKLIEHTAEQIARLIGAASR